MRIASRRLSTWSDAGRERQRQRQATKVTLLRTRGARCELCGATPDRRPLEQHHVAGLGGSKLGPEWRDHPAVLMILCAATPADGLGCHERVQRFLDADLVRRALDIALGRVRSLDGDISEPLAVLGRLKERTA